MSTRPLYEIRDLMLRRHDFIPTERAYRDWVKCPVRIHNMQSGDGVGHGKEKIEPFLTSLESDRQVSTSIRGHAMDELVILDEHVLMQPLSGEVNTYPLVQTPPDARPARP